MLKNPNRHRIMNETNIKTIILLVLFVVLIVPISWCVNLYKLTQCDFKASWKGEAIHAVGLVIPPAAIITAWLDYK